MEVVKPRERIAISVSDAAALLGVSVKTAYTVHTSMSSMRCRSRYRRGKGRAEKRRRYVAEQRGKVG